MNWKLVLPGLILLLMTSSIFFFLVDSTIAQDTQTSKFASSNILNQPGGSLAGGMELGDPDNDGAGEVIVVGGSGEAGRVTVIDYNKSKNGFDTPTIWIDNQALVDVISADVDPHFDGEEIIVGGYSKNVTVLYWEGGRTEPRVSAIDKLSQQIFGITAGELNNSHAGWELAVVDGKTNDLIIYQSSATADKWEKIIVEFNETLRNVEAGDFDSVHTGDELVILSTNGTVYSVMNNNGDWVVERIWQDSDSLLDAAIGDADQRLKGNEIIVVGLSWRATMLHKSEDGTWNVSTLWKASGGLEGIDIGEFDPSHEGNEVAMGGYSRTVVMMYLENNHWVTNVIYEDKESSQSELNGVVIGEFSTGHDGNELMVVGASGVTTLLEYIIPDFTLSTVSSAKTITTGENVVFTVQVGAVSSFSGNVELEVETVLSWTLSSPSVKAPGTSSLTLTTDPSTQEGSYKVIVKGSYGTEEKTIELTVTVISLEQPDFSINASAILLELNRLPDKKTDVIPTQTMTVRIDALFGFSDTVWVNVSGLNDDFEVVKSADSILPGESMQISIRLVKNPEPENNDFTFTITARSGDRVHYDTVSIKLYPADQVVDNGDSDDAGSENLQKVLLVMIIIVIVMIIILLTYKYNRRKIEKQGDKDIGNRSKKRMK